MKISIITAVYNGAKTVADTMRSVAEQSHSDVEHIIIDGASTDGTLGVIGQYAAGNTRIVSEPDNGVYDAMNKGLRLATGEVVGFLNADDVYENQDVLKRIAGVFDNSEIDACYGDLVYVSPRDTRRIVRYWRSRPYRDGLFERGWMPAHPTFYAQRSVYRRLGGFDPEFERQADFELTMRYLAVHKIRSVYIPEILVRMRAGGMSNSRVVNILRGNVEAYRACRKNNLPISPAFIGIKILSRIPQFFMRPSGRQAAKRS